MGKLKRLIARCLFIPLSWISLKYCQSLGAFLGRVVLKFNSKRSNIIHRNLETCFPNLSSAERMILHDKVAAETGKWVIESGRTWFQNPKTLINSVSVKNPEIMDNAFAKQKGVVVVLPHFGNWEMMNYYLPQRYPSASMYKPIDSETMEELVLQSRSRAGAELFKTDSGGVRKAFKFLKKGGALVVLADHLPTREAGVYAPFFGFPALTGKLTNSLIKFNSSEVVLATVLRKPNGEGFEVEFYPVESMNIGDDIEAATHLNKAIEKSILKAPEQYQWVYTRFAKPPEGTKNIYK